MKKSSKQGKRQKVTCVLWLWYKEAIKKRKLKPKAHLIFVTTITTAGCVEILAKCKIFQLEHEKIAIQCKMWHRV